MTPPYSEDLKRKLAGLDENDLITIWSTVLNEFLLRIPMSISDIQGGYTRESLHDVHHNWRVNVGVEDDIVKLDVSLIGYGATGHKSKLWAQLTVGCKGDRRLFFVSRTSGDLAPDSPPLSIPHFESLTTLKESPAMSANGLNFELTLRYEQPIFTEVTVREIRES